MGLVCSTLPVDEGNRPLVELFDDRVLLVCFRGINLGDVINVRGSCRRGRSIDVASYLAFVFENSHAAATRQRVLLDKFCERSALWPARVLPILLRARGVGIDHRDDCGYTLLGTAASSGRADIVHALLSEGADIDGSNNHGHTPVWLAG